MKQEIIFPETQKLKSQADETAQFANELTIADHPAYEVAADFLQGIKALEREIESTFDPAIKAANAAHKAVLEAKAKHYDPIKAAEKVIKLKMAKFQEEEERRREEEERKLKEEARKLEEDDRNRRAEALIAEGKPEEALALLEAPPEPVAMIVAPAPPKVKGVSVRHVWKAKIIDETKIPRDYLVPDIDKINRVIKASEGKIAIPGIEPYQEKIIASR